MAREYLFYYTLFSTPFLLSNCLSVFVRNDGAAGLQPLWGQAFGRKNKKELEEYFRTGIKINVIAFAVIYGVLCVFRTPVVRLFNSDPALVKMASEALPVFAFSFLFMSVNLICTSYFYSTKQTVKSNVIAISRGIVVKALAIFLIPAVLGDGYVWYPAAAAEAVTLVICLLLNNYKKQLFFSEKYI